MDGVFTWEIFIQTGNNHATPASYLTPVTIFGDNFGNFMTYNSSLISVCAKPTFYGYEKNSHITMQL